MYPALPSAAEDEGIVSVRWSASIISPLGKIVVAIQELDDGIRQDTLSDRGTLTQDRRRYLRGEARLEHLAVPSTREQRFSE